MSVRYGICCAGHAMDVVRVIQRRQGRKEEGWTRDDRWQKRLGFIKMTLMKILHIISHQQVCDIHLLLLA